MNLILLTIKSLRNRLFPVSLCIFSMALSVCLFLGVERVRTGAKDGFMNTLSQTDLVVGARGGKLPLLLYSVFHIGNPTNNIRHNSYEHFKNHPMVAWTIPFSLGDSYKGRRVVGTNENFFKHYKYRGDREIEFAHGEPFDDLFDVVVGHEVAESFNLEIGTPITLAHGLQSTQEMQHDNTPFRIKGILSPTQTPVDKALYVSLHGIEAMHIGWESGMPEEQDLADPETITKDQLELSQVSSFLLGAKSRIHTLRLRSEISNFKNEPLMAVIPGLVLQELWALLGHVESILRLISLAVLIVGLLGITITLYTSLQERRREMAILRSLGSGPFHISSLLLSEAIAVVMLGSLAGVGLLYLGLLSLRPYLEAEFNLYLPIEPLQSREWLALAGVWAAGLVAGLIPALKATFQSLKDGLSVDH